MSPSTDVVTADDSFNVTFHAPLTSITSALDVLSSSCELCAVGSGFGVFGAVVSDNVDDSDDELQNKKKTRS